MITVPGALDEVRRQRSRARADRQGLGTAHSCYIGMTSGDAPYVALIALFMGVTFFAGRYSVRMTTQEALAPLRPTARTRSDSSNCRLSSSSADRVVQPMSAAL